MNVMEGVLPASAALLRALFVVTFTVHLLLAGTVLGATLIMLYEKMDGRRHSMQSAVAKRLTVVFAFAVNFGVPALLFSQLLYGKLFYTSSIFTAVYWLAVPVMLMAAYYGLYHHADGKKTPAVVTAFTAGIFLLTAVVFANNVSIMQSPAQWASNLINVPGTMVSAGDSTLIPRIVHFVVAAIALGGLFRALTARFVSSPDAHEGIASGMKIFTVALMAQIFIGFWLLASQSQDAMSAMLGGDVVMTLVLASGLLTATAAIYSGTQKQPMNAAVLSGVAVLFMTILRELLREMRLVGYVDFAASAVQTQTVPLLLFLASAALGVALTVYMIRKSYSQA